jgi:(p)ppGpp synthase/HD superfamily hydrolase
MDKINKAVRFAIKAHSGQIDDNWKDYFEAHVAIVGDIVSMVTNDEDIICAAYLHDTIEDTDVTVEDLVKNFGNRVAELVMEVTHDGDKPHGYYFPRLKSKDAILIKFADRLSNISRMESWSKERQEHYLKRSKFWNDKAR